MPSVRELTALYENFMLTPLPGPEVCDVCFNLTAGYQRCYACAHGHRALDAVVPVSYSVAGEQLHHALACYKRLTGDVARRLGVELAAVLWRFLADHERCLAHASGVRSFQVATTVPSGDRERDEPHPLRWIAGHLVAPTRERYERLLRRSGARVEARAFDATRYEPVRKLSGEAVLLVDDTWTTGANAQSAAAALKVAGAGAIGAVVLGRHVNRHWDENNRRLQALPPFDWARCALCAGSAGLGPSLADSSSHA
ncbi:MAG TPA: hypothetical protein VGY32_04945 [Solirubrobacteraceae bacterium]|nr:hypothetical protein [Solirubrobacteraceae bacterium]